MASVLTPFSNLVNPGRRQLPQGPLQIDWTNPLTNGLIGAYVPGITLRNLVGIGANLITAGAAAIVANQEGPGVDTIVAGAKLTSNGSVPTVFTNWTQCSLFWRGFKYSGSFTQFPSLLSIDYNNAGGSPYALASLDAVSATNSFRVFYNTGGSQANGSSFDLGGLLYHTVHASFTVNGNIVVFLDGLVQETISYGATGPSSTSTTQVSMGHDLIEAGGSGNHNTTVAYIWKRALSNQEQVQMYLNPFDILIPAEYELPILQATVSTFTWLGMERDVPEARILASRKVTDLVGY